MITRDTCTDSRGRIRPTGRTLQDIEVMQLCRPAVERIRKEQAHWIARARAAAGLERREVAIRMGYQNVDRGMSRIARWERGEDAVCGDRIPALARALDAPVEELAAFARREQEVKLEAAAEAGRRAEANLLAGRRELRLLALHASALLEPGPAAARLGELPDVRVCAAGCSLAYLGGGPFSLCILLRAWQKGHLTTTCDCCGGTLLLTWVAGSPLSGRHRFTGICRNTREVRCVTLSDTSEAMRLLRYARKFGARSGHGVHPDLTVAEVLGRVGLEVPLVRIRDAQGADLATFDPTSGRISALAEGPAGGEGDGPSGDLRLETSERRGPARIHGHPVIGSIAPLSFGAWLGDTLRLVNRDGRQWTLHPGYLEDPDSQVVAWFDAPVPPSVAAWSVLQRKTN